MSETSDVLKPGVGRFRRASAVLLSLALPGAGHCLVGAFRRGVVWVVALAILRVLLLYVVPVVAVVWSQLAIGFAGRAAAAIDAARTVRATPAWGRVAAGWVAVIVTTWLVNLAVVAPLASYYAQRYAQGFVIPSGAMAPRLLVGDSIMVDRSAYRDRAPQRYDIVVFPHPEDETRDVIKRIVGMPGDVIVVRGAQVVINGQVLREPYLDSKLLAATSGLAVTCRYACEPVTVPADSYYVLGDNRNNSEDSRLLGFIKREKIKGKVHSIYWSWDPSEQRPRTDRIGRLP